MKKHSLHTAGCILFTALLITVSCKNKSSLVDSTTNDWNSGKIIIATDENLKDITEQLVQIYQHENENAHIVLDYQPQDKVINDFVNGKIRSMIISRNLTKQETEISAQNQKVEIRETIFAYNAVALITNKNFKDTVIDISAIRNYLLPGSVAHLIFDNKQSGIARFIMQKTSLEKELFKNAFVANNSDEVIEYIHRNDNAIGFISFNRISDAYDPQTQKILSSIKVLDLQQNNITTPISQENIFNFTYPLQQPMNIVLGNNPELIGKGFTNFLCRAKAAKILLKAGLVPRFMPERKITVHNDLKTN